MSSGISLTCKVPFISRGDVIFNPFKGQESSITDSASLRFGRAHLLPSLNDAYVACRGSRTRGVADTAHRSYNVLYYYVEVSDLYGYDEIGLRKII